MVPVLCSCGCSPRSPQSSAVPNGRGLLGWPAYVVDGLPDLATAGTGDASIWFADVRSCCRVVDRQRVTVQVLRQRYIELGLIVRRRIGGDLVQPAADHGPVDGRNCLHRCGCTTRRPSNRLFGIKHG